MGKHRNKSMMDGLSAVLFRGVSYVAAVDIVLKVFPKLRYQYEVTTDLRRQYKITVDLRRQYDITTDLKGVEE